MKKPTDYADFVRLSENASELATARRIRLIELGFSADSTVAIRAFELLSQIGGDYIEDDYSDIPTEILEKGEKRADRFLRELANGDTSQEKD